jgi:hypothetical protein
LFPLGVLGVAEAVIVISLSLAGALGAVMIVIVKVLWSLECDVGGGLQLLPAATHAAEAQLHFVQQPHCSLFAHKLCGVVTQVAGILGHDMVAQQ